MATPHVVGPHRTNPLPEHFDGKPHGGFYTHDDIREIVAYAADRFVTVVPEIEMPGHSQAVVSAYPEPGSVDSPVEVRATWSVSPYILNPEQSTIAFMQNVLEEVLELFPGPWIHIGGDEAEKTQWKANPAIQARIKTLGLKDEHELQSWFIRQMDSFLTARNRRLIGWDEILEGGLAENATVMAWRGPEHAVTAARAGHDTVLAPTSHTYFDYYQAKDTAGEPRAIGGSCRSSASTRGSPCRPTWNRRSTNMSWACRGSFGPNTCPTRRPSSTWPSRAPARQRSRLVPRRRP